MKFIVGLLLIIAVTQKQKIVCDCDGEPYPIDTAYKLSTHMFTGKVVRIESKRTLNRKGEFTGVTTITFDSTVSLKGTYKKPVEIATDNSDCRINFKIGKTYLVGAIYDSTLRLPFVDQCFFGCPDISNGEVKKFLERRN